MRLFKDMSKRKKTVLIIFLGVFLVGVFGVISLELLSRTCPTLKQEYPSCVGLIEKYIPDVDWVETLNSFITPNPLTEDLETVIATRVFEVERTEINGLNGIACGRYAFVSRDLPSAAKRYVKTHEALHLIGNGSETETNYAAAEREPFGMVQTVIYSVYNGFKNRPVKTYPCALANSWRIFKVYFLDQKYAASASDI